MGTEEYTPAMRQYLDIKERHKDCIVLFRMGDFYEIFFDDAHLAARELSITLTTRNKNKQDSIALCGFPYHAASGYIARLVNRGYKVAVCEQMEDPKLAKGVVKREVVRIITPGLITSADGIITVENVFIGALYPSLDGGQGGGSFLDLSTGEFYLLRWSHKEDRESLGGIELRELIVPERIRDSALLKVLLADRESCQVNYCPEDLFASEEALALLSGYLTNEEMIDLNLPGNPLSAAAAGALLRYVENTQKTSLAHLRKLKWHDASDYLVLDDTARRNLELFSTAIDNRTEGSLFHLLDETATSMGKRKLRWWLANPLKNPSRIRRRLTAVAEMKKNHLARGKLGRLLKEVHDLERLGGRIVMNLATARDLAAFRDSLKPLGEIKELVSGFNSPLIRAAGNSLDLLADLTLVLDQALVDSPPSSLREGGIIRKGYDAALDELTDLVKNGRKWIASLEEKERLRTGINSLKVGFNNIFGYYLEIGKAHTGQAPDDYIRKQTLVNAERYTNQELKEYEYTVLNAKERAREREYELFAGIRNILGGQIERIQKTASSLAIFDVVAALAQVAEKYNYTEPQVTGDGLLLITEGRHPVVEQYSQAQEFVPNDTFMDLEGNRFLVITGPNMSGKSTYIRQVALISIMAQMGSFVPAKEAVIGAADRIFTRIGAADSLARGQSTFMVEMIEVANIIKNATDRSLIILDEVGRGTSTFDGMAIAWAVAEHLNDKAKIGARTLFATHYHQLTELALTNEGVKNYNIAVGESSETIIFLRKIVPGGTNRSYGIHVGRLAGLPESVVVRAREILMNLEKGEFDASGMPRLAQHGQAIPQGQLGLFGGEEGLVADEIRESDPLNMTPLEALNKINIWKKRLST